MEFQNTKRRRSRNFDDSSGADAADDVDDIDGANVHADDVDDADTADALMTHSGNEPQHASKEGNN